MMNKRLMALAAALFAAGTVCLAQTKQEQVIEGGGRNMSMRTGRFPCSCMPTAPAPTTTWK